MEEETDSIAKSAAELATAFHVAAAEIADRLARSAEDQGSSDHWFAVKAYLDKQMGVSNVTFLYRV